VAWDRRYFPFLVQNQKERNRKAADCVIASIVSFMQSNLQRSTIVARVLTRTVIVKGIDTALLQKPRYCGGRITGLNVPDYNLFCAS